MVAGYNMANGQGGAAGFACPQGNFPTLIEAAQKCHFTNNTGAGNALFMGVDFYNCWDGVHLDSPDHRSHMAYGSNGCPASHPYMIPGFTMKAAYPIDSDFYANLDASGNWNGRQDGWHLSSDEMHGSKPGSTVHGDWFGAWDDNILNEWTQGCIDHLLTCVAGQLGDGRGLSYPKVQMHTSPVLVDPPQGGMPGMPGMGGG